MVGFLNFNAEFKLPHYTTAIDPRKCVLFNVWCLAWIQNSKARKGNSVIIHKSSRDGDKKSTRVLGSLLQYEEFA